VDVSPTERKQKWVSLGVVTDTAARVALRKHIEETGVDSVERFHVVNSPSITFRQASDTWLSDIRSGVILRKRKRTPIKAATISSYESAVTSLCGKYGLENVMLSDLRNEAAKQLVTRMRAEKASDKTIVNYFQVVQQVVSSAVNVEGEQLHPRTWNLEHIGLPVVDARRQKTPAFTFTDVERISGATSGRLRMLFCLLAGSGLRAGEVLGLRIEHFTSDCRVFHVKESVWKNQVQDPKTPNAIRVVDIPEVLAAAVREYIGKRESGLLFSTASGRPLSQRNMLLQLHTILKKLSIPRCGFHAFRRFRTGQLRKLGCPIELVKLWVGHSKNDITDKYTRHLSEDMEYRREWCERAGLGFTLPVVRIERSESVESVPVVVPQPVHIM
jgi:integrase